MLPSGRGRALIFVLLLWLGSSCGGPQRPTNQVDRMAVLDLGGDVRVDLDTGSIRLDLAYDACMEYVDARDAEGNRGFERQPCVPFAHGTWREVRIRPPWSDDVVPASAGGENWVSFKIDWTTTGIDPFTKDASARLGRAWRIEAPSALNPFAWEPQANHIEDMLTLIGEATGTETAVGVVNGSPAIVVTEMRFVDDVRAGAASELVVTVSNKGKGDAFRLYATTRSNIAALHALRIGFGKLAAGESKTRRLRVHVPRENDETEALVVLVFSEAHNFAPAQAQTRAKVQPASDIAVLALTCHVAGWSSKDAHPTVDAGQLVDINCEIKSTRSAANRVHLRATIGGGEPASTEGFDVAVNETVPRNITIEVPKDAVTDAELVVTIHADEEGAGAKSQAQLTLLVARPKICAEGKLTRAQFDKKRTELRRARDARLISQEEYEKYEAELVTCLEGD